MKNKILLKTISFICMIAVLGFLFDGNKNVLKSATIADSVTIMEHKMATEALFNSVADGYINRVSGYEADRLVTYDAGKQAMKYAVTGKYTSSGCKYDITELVKTAPAGATLGISADVITTEGKTAASIGFLYDSATALTPDMQRDANNSTFSTISYTATLPASYSKVYFTIFGDAPVVYIKNVKLYYVTGDPITITSPSVPDKAVGFVKYDFTTNKKTQASNFKPYVSGNGTVAGGTMENMKYTAPNDSDDNGIKLDITSYLKYGRSGDTFGAAFMMKAEGWSLAENKGNKATLFFEVIDKDNRVKSTIPLASGGPNDTNSNLTPSYYEFGTDWLTSPITGEGKIDFDESDTVYLCIKQKNKVQEFDDIYVWGDIDSFVNPTNINVSTPVLNLEKNAAVFYLENLSPDNKNLTIRIKAYESGVIKSIDEYNYSLASGTETTAITLPAKQGDEISIYDSNGNYYINPIKLGTMDWVGTWATAELSDSPASPNLKNSTFRQVLRISNGGTQLRLKYSNEYGETPLTIKAVHVAKPVATASSVIDMLTDTQVTFNGGEEGITIPAGGTAYSDVVEFKAPDLTRLAVSTYYGDVPSKVTGHPGARTTSYQAPGDRVSGVIMGTAVSREQWFFLTDIDVMAAQGSKAIACFGDSITDGYGVTTNADNRWTDVFASRIQKDSATTNLSVLNEGIGGNSIFGGLGPAAKNRFERDVVNHPGIKYAIIFIGINDIGYAENTSLKDQMIAEYKIMVDKAHAKGIKVYGCTILPFKGHSYYDGVYGAMKEQIRQDINTWIRTSGYYDAVIDLDAILRDSSDPTILNSLYDSGDHLHPSVAGYKKIGDSIDLSLFKN